MANQMQKVVRRLAPVFGAGMLLQASGCQIDGAELAAGLTSTIITQAVTAWVFNFFSLGTGGF
jgi:hypothetical protein